MAYALDHQARLRAAEAGARTQRRILAALQLDAQLAKARVPAILGDVVEEVVDDIRGDDVTDVLGLAVLVRVKGSGLGLG